ncbi:MAG: peptidase associated/transthyretin-like domain-containing protein [Gemmatimonadaceae bacterium]
MRVNVLSAVIMLLAGPAYAQVPAHTTVVKVVDTGGVPVPFASVSVNSRTPGFSDADGLMQQRSETGETASLRVRRMGYRPVEFRTARDSLSGVFTVTLEPIVLNLEAVTVTVRANTPLSRTGFYERAQLAQRGSFAAQFYGPEDLDAQSAGRLSDLLQTSRYVRVVTNGMVTRVLGRGNCEMLLLLDGRWVRGPIDDVTGAGALMAVEVYPSITSMPIANLPPMMNSSCGVIVMWTGGRR